MKKSKKIGDMSVYEASDFWDEHDFTQFKDVEEVKEMHFSLKKKKYIPLDIMQPRRTKKIGQTE